jgi:thioredoxin-dependent peroxiredoxin
MATIRLKGNLIHTVGQLPSVGSIAPPFRLTAVDLLDVDLDRFKGKKKILNIVPSLDTGVCATSARRFNQEVEKLDEVILLNISADLPFAQKRFCDVESLKNIVTLSTMRSPAFGKDYGVLIVDGPLAGLMSRAVLVLDGDNKIIHAEQVPEIGQEPNYHDALAAAGQRFSSLGG